MHSGGVKRAFEHPNDKRPLIGVLAHLFNERNHFSFGVSGGKRCFGFFVGVSE